MNNCETQFSPSPNFPSSKIFQRILKELNLPWEQAKKKQSFRSAEEKHDTAESQNLIDSELPIGLDLGMDFSDFPGAKKTEPAIELLLSKFRPPKTAQYWIISGENKEGEELCEKLPLLLQDNPLIRPSRDVGLLFYYSPDPKAVYSLTFSNSSSAPLLRKCDNVEDELYKKEKSKKLLAVPSSKLQDGQLLIMTPPITQIGIIDQAHELFWAFDFFSCENERIVFFEDGLTPTTLRQSPILEDFEKSGHLHIIFCAWKMIKESGMKTDMNSPEEAARIMFAKQGESLCPSCWRNIVFNSDFKVQRPGENDFLLKDLLSLDDESGLSLLRGMRLPQQPVFEYAKIKCDISGLLVSELKLAYIDVLLSLLKVGQNAKIDDIGKSEELLFTLTKTLFSYFSHQKNCFPTSPAISGMVTSCLAFVLFDFSCQIEQLLREAGISQYKKSRLHQEKNLYKHSLFTDLPDFQQRSNTAVLRLASKMELLQKICWEIEDNLK